MAQLTIQQIFDLAAEHHNAGRLSEAEKLYRDILAREPRHAGALHYLGVIAHQVGRNDVAADLIGRAIALQPNYAEAYNNLSLVLKENGQPDQAIAACRQAIALNPRYAEAFNNLGNVLRDKGQLDEAIAACRQAIALKPDYVEASNNLGNALSDKGQLDEAVACYRRAIVLKPNYANAHYNLGAVLTDQDLLDEAIASCRQAIALKPDYAEAHHNLANAMKYAGRLDEAVVAYRQAIALRPEFPEAHTDLALVLLLQEDFAAAWQEYEWRWKLKSFSSLRRDLPQPRWDGSELKNRTLLLHAEQGFGDTIQFIRYVPMVLERGGKIIVECQPELKRLLQNSARGWQVIARGEPVPAFDVHCPLLSLPLVFGTTVGSIPWQGPYLQADAEMTEKWRKKLTGDWKYLKVGLAWAGSPAFRNHRLRSVQLSMMRPLVQAKNARFFSLQKGEAGKQAANPPAGMDLIDCTADLHDFADTAALIANLDLVISSDTSVAHLAGAMGKPVWVMTPFAPDWRWLLEREDSPWYPTMRLFRQTRIGDWKDVLERISMELASSTVN